MPRGSSPHSGRIHSVGFSIDPREIYGVRKEFCPGPFRPEFFLRFLCTCAEEVREPFFLFLPADETAITALVGSLRCTPEIKELSLSFCTSVGLASEDLLPIPRPVRIVRAVERYTIKHFCWSLADRLNRITRGGQDPAFGMDAELRVIAWRMGAYPSRK